MKTSKARWAYAAGAAVACAAVIVATSLAATAGTRDTALAPAAAAVAAAPERTQALGDVIDAGGWVLYAKAVDEPALPGTHFGIVAGVRSSSGKLTDVVLTNETTGSDRAPGFHAVEGTMEVDGRSTPTFGYYAGPAASITATTHGKKVTAGQATWSEDAEIQIFWFAPSATGIAHLAAYDAKGHQLPAGNAGVGVG